MFYTENKFLPYPNRSILQDVLMRSPCDFTRTSTGKNGCKDILEKQLGKNKSDYTLEQILASASDFNADKMRPTDDCNDMELLADERLDYHRRLEDISDEWIRSYTIQAIIGFKLHRNEKSKIDKENAIDIGGYVDKETGEIISKSELEEVPMVFTAEEIREAQIELPYLLKILQIGSERYGAHLLSFIIAMEKAYKNMPDKKFRMMPKDFTNIGVYRVNNQGYIGTLFDIKENTYTYNANRGFRAAVAWATQIQDKGKIKDIYYDAYRRLLKVSEILEVDLADEDPKQYDKDFVENAVCLYLASNEEFIEAYGFGNKKVISFLEKENISALVKQVSDEVYIIESVYTFQERMEIVAVTADAILKAEQIWKPNSTLVYQFLSKVLRQETNTLSIDMSKYTIWKSLIVNENGVPFKIKMSAISNITDRTIRGVLCISGHIIVVDDLTNSFALRVISIEDALYSMQHPEDKKGISYVHF